MDGFEKGKREVPDFLPKGAQVFEKGYDISRRSEGAGMRKENNKLVCCFVE